MQEILLLAIVGRYNVAMTENDQDNYGFFQRLHKALGPITGGLLLDFVDLTTYGPMGLVFGALLGGLVAWWITSVYNVRGTARVFLVTLAAMYCTIPLTEPFPIATIFCAICRFFEPPIRRLKQKKASKKHQHPRKYIDSDVS